MALPTVLTDAFWVCASVSVWTLGCTSTCRLPLSVSWAPCTSCENRKLLLKQSPRCIALPSPYSVNCATIHPEAQRPGLGVEIVLISGFPPPPRTIRHRVLDLPPHTSLFPPGYTTSVSSLGGCHWPSSTWAPTPPPATTTIKKKKTKTTSSHSRQSDLLKAEARPCHPLSVLSPWRLPSLSGSAFHPCLSDALLPVAASRSPCCSLPASGALPLFCFPPVRSQGATLLPPPLFHFLRCTVTCLLTRLALSHGRPHPDSGLSSTRAGPAHPALCWAPIPAQCLGHNRCSVNVTCWNTFQ